MDNWLNVGVSGRAIWPKIETEVEFGGFKLLLKPATKDKDQSIHINLRHISDVQALTLINRFLSALAWCDDQAMENLYGWSGTSKPVPVSKQNRKIGSSIAFPFYRELDPDPKAQLALALYREGLTVNSTPFSFLSYFKILNIFWQDKFLTVSGKRENPLIEGIRNNLQCIRDPQAIERLTFLSTSQPDVATYLYQSGRCAVAHAFTSPIVDPDDLTDLHRLSSDLSIIKSLAEHLIISNLGVSKSISK